MRHIEFRMLNKGIDINTGKQEWDYKELPYECFDDNFTLYVSDTLSQFTGLLDKHGTKIFEGDIVQEDGWNNIVVEYGLQEVDAFVGMGFNLWSFYDSDENGYNANSKRLCSSIEVIGNIYQSPELVNGSDN